jgi:hypothetical protein
LPYCELNNHNIFFNLSHYCKFLQNNCGRQIWRLTVISSNRYIIIIIRLFIFIFVYNKKLYLEYTKNKKQDRKYWWRMLIEELLHAPQGWFGNDYCVTEMLNCERYQYCYLKTAIWITWYVNPWYHCYWGWQFDIYSCHYCWGLQIKQFLRVQPVLYFVVNNLFLSNWIKTLLYYGTVGINFKVELNKQLPIFIYDFTKKHTLFLSFYLCVHFPCGYPREVDCPFCCWDFSKDHEKFFTQVFIV